MLGFPVLLVSQEHDGPTNYVILDRTPDRGPETDEPVFVQHINTTREGLTIQKEKHLGTK